MAGLIPATMLSARLPSPCGRHREQSEAIQSLRDCGGGLVWIASLSLAMTTRSRYVLLYFISHSWAGSLWKRHRRFGPAMTLR